MGFSSQGVSKADINALQNAVTAVTPQTAVQEIVGGSNGSPLSVTTRSINVKAFGAKGDGVTDDTAAILAATIAGYDPIADRITPVEFPLGRYMVHELNIPSNVKVHWRAAAGCRQAALFYNGAGGVGSYLVNQLSRTNQGGYQGLQFNGSDPNNTTVCEHLLMINYADLPAVWSDLQFAQCFGDAIVLNGTMNNWHLDRVRFDSVGGWGITISGAAGSENRPFSLSRWTLDNNVGGPYQALLTSLGYFDPSTTRWGEGAVKVIAAAGITLGFHDARIELNRPCIPENGRVGVFVDATTSGNGGEWKFDHIRGYAHADDGAAMMQANCAKVGFHLSDPQSLLGHCRALEYVPNVIDATQNIGGGAFGAPMMRSLTGQLARGIVLNNQLIESRNSLTGDFQTTRYRRGDVIYNRGVIPGTNGAAWIVTAPTDYSYGQTSAQTITTAARVTAGSAVVDMSAAQSLFFQGEPGMAVTVMGAGPSGADLNTTIVDRDTAAETWTLAAAATTSVNPATINSQTVAFKQFGDVVSYGAGAPTTGTYNKGEKCWNTNPAETGTAGSKYIVLGWICTVAGSPGTWLPLRCLTGN